MSALATWILRELVAGRVDVDDPAPALHRLALEESIRIDADGLLDVVGRVLTSPQLVFPWVEPRDPGYHQRRHVIEGGAETPLPVARCPICAVGLAVDWPAPLVWSCADCSPRIQVAFAECRSEVRLDDDTRHALLCQWVAAHGMTDGRTGPSLRETASAASVALGWVVSEHDCEIARDASRRMRRRQAVMA